LHLPRAVVFGDRRGYVRLALKTGVPVVPFATIGSHHTYLLLPWIGDALGARLRRWGVVRDARVPVPLASLGVLAATIACALGAAPLWALALAVAALVITTDILEPIDVRAATALIEDPAARVEAAHRLVHGRLAAHVAAMRHGR
jgi:1-acyl-sn-glycerol-3-phosphate acyltransferase